MNLAWSWPWECNGFFAWLFYEWDMRDHWNGPTKLFRRHGYRVFGLETEWIYLQVED